MKKRPAALALFTLAALLGGCANQPEQKTAPAQTAVPAAPLQDTAPVIVSTGYLARPDVQRYINQKVADGRFKRTELEAFFANVAPKPRVIEIMNRPGTSRPWYEFAKNNAGGNRIAGGQKYCADHVDSLQAVSQRYGVAPEVIVAIVGIETNYGSNTGSFRVADVLTTLAFDYPRRADYFQKELDEFLQLAHEERQDFFTFKGSYAGAMGMPQFMPSSYRRYAVDFNGDGHRNIWSDAGDAHASVAHYLQMHGWKRNEPISLTVQISPNPQLQAIIDGKTEMKYSVGDYKRMGVVIADQKNVPDTEKAQLFQLETAPGQYEYRLGLPNFYAIWQYNNSRLYVSAVEAIANGVCYR